MARGKAVEWTLQEFCSIIEKDLPRPLKHGSSVSSIPGTLQWPALRREIDFFVLLNQDGSWRISSKVFFAHSRA
jgi:hypothetical protein